MLRRCVVFLVLSSVLSLCAVLAQQPSPSPAPAQPAAQQAVSVDQNEPVERIKKEGMNRSQVMETLSYLSDVIGPRLTGSPNMKRANEWTRDQLTKWGLQNAHLEAWGPFGRGWALKRFSAQVIEPQAIPLIAFPKAWSPALPGPLTAEVVYVDATTDADLAKFKGQLKDKIVLTSAMRSVPARFEAPGTRLNEKELLALADAPEPRPGGRRNFQLNPTQRAAFGFFSKKLQFFREEGAALLIDPARGDGGTIFVQSASVAPPAGVDSTAPNAPRTPSPYDKNAPKITPQLVLAIEHYNRIARMIKAGEQVKMTVDLAVEWHDSDPMGYNTIAEIPGSDLKDEIVMLGGHMDSWHSGTGATDNAAGVSVAMEVVRIIQTLGLKPRRTIRIALWTGEEQGLLGSRAYVAQHFGKFETVTGGQATASGGASGNGTATSSSAPPPKLVTLPEYEKFSAYFNLDNGTGRVRGVYLQGNEGVRSIFRQWLMPFRDRPDDKNPPVWGASTLSISNTGGTDHLAFDAIGLPGFQFIQDEIEYDTRTHHSNQDVFDRIQGDDMKQAATIMAWFVYSAAMRDEKLPRKPVAGR
ncbi:MAG TPA: M20/M25/M40 family metallo-hydrolase [Pyrinomonadaceae bacterium]|nr:M20/M25/M40 family metallo-hydrolase [Pyrinomonadaceae bacterium]